MTVYPFYTEVVSSTGKQVSGVGMRKKEGNMNTRVYQRNKGEIQQPFSIYQWTEQEDDGTWYCYTKIYDNINEKVLTVHKTEY